MLFHPRTGSLVLLSNGFTYAQRVNAYQEFTNGIVLSQEPIPDDFLFQVRLEKKIRTWSGSIQIGLTSQNPETMTLPSSATDFSHGSWILSGTSVVKNGLAIAEDYGQNLDELNEGDRVGILRSSSGYLHFYVNGIDQGIAATDVPTRCFVVIDLYAEYSPDAVSSRFLQEEANHARFSSVSTSDSEDGPHLEASPGFGRRPGLAAHIPSSARGPPARLPSTGYRIPREINIPDILSSDSSSSSLSPGISRRTTADSPVFSSLRQRFLNGILDNRRENDDVQGQSVTDAARRAETITTQHSESFDNDLLRFHETCGAMICLSLNARCAERTRPLDEFNNGLVITNRPLQDEEMFEIRIDTLVDKWSGSVEVGVTTMNPNTADLPVNIAGLPDGTVVMSGRSVLINGMGLRREYGEVNLNDPW